MVLLNCVDIMCSRSKGFMFCIGWEESDMRALVGLKRTFLFGIPFVVIAIGCNGSYKNKYFLIIYCKLCSICRIAADFVFIFNCMNNKKY